MAFLLGFRAHPSQAIQELMDSLLRETFAVSRRGPCENILKPFGWSCRGRHIRAARRTISFNYKRPELATSKSFLVSRL